MIKIGITSRIVKDLHTNEIRSSLDLRWFKVFETMKWHPVIIPMGYNICEFESSQPLDGLILSGGNDLPFFSSNEEDILRDSFERDIYELAIRKKIPVLGVCRGLQAIASDFSDTLLVNVKNHVGVKHLVIATEVAHNLNLRDRIVNSYHNYGLLDSDDFCSLYLTQDGFVEAFYMPEKNVLCIMWHPERESDMLIDDRNLLQLFFEGNLK